MVWATPTAGAAHHFRVRRPSACQASACQASATSPRTCVPAPGQKNRTGRSRDRPSRGRAVNFGDSRRRSHRAPWTPVGPGFGPRFRSFRTGRGDGFVKIGPPGVSACWHPRDPIVGHGHRRLAGALCHATPPRGSCRVASGGARPLRTGPRPRRSGPVA